MATHCRKLIVTGIYQANSYQKFVMSYWLAFAPKAFWILWFNLCFILFFNRLLSQLCCSFLFGEYGLIGEGLCCRLQDLGVLFVWVMYLQRSSWPIKSCGTFASHNASPNVSHPCGLKYFLLRSTSLTKSTTLLPWTVSPLYFSSPFSF
jgi:hypothetical protein